MRHSPEPPAAELGEHQGAAEDRARKLSARVQRGAAYLLLFAVMGAVAAMSWSGIYDWARTELHWSPAHAALVPIALDIAAMAASGLGLDSISKGESALAFRFLAAAFVALSAFVNWRESLKTGNISEEIFFPAMSGLAYALVHAVMEKARREVRRQQHGQTARQLLAPLPRTGVLAWLPIVGSPLRALGAVRLAVAERLPEAPAPQEQSHPRPAIEHRDIPAVVAITDLTQSDAIRHAIAAVGTTSARDVVEWLDAHGWPNVATQRVYDVIRRDNLRAISSTGEQQAI